MRIVLVGFVMLALLIAGGCASSSMPVEIPGFSQASDKDQVLKVLDKAHRGMEARSVSRVMAQVSPAYLDTEGRDYEALKKSLNRLIKDYRKIVIKRTQPQVLIEGDRAKAIETFGTTADPAEPSKTPPLNLQGQVTVYLEKGDGAWRIVEWGMLN